jgi:hypothetical protein
MSDHSTSESLDPPGTAARAEKAALWEDFVDIVWLTSGRVPVLGALRQE